MPEERATVEEIRLLLKYMAQGYKVPEVLHDVVWDAAVREIEGKNRVVIIKRDPNVERGRMQARYAKIVEGNTIDMHPATVGAFGADFDGDTMAVFVPLSEEAQKEAKEKMISATGSNSINDPNFELSKEMITGIFTLTYFEKGASYKKMSDFSKLMELPIETKVEFRVKSKSQKTTVGRVIFNGALPDWYPYINEPVDKGKLKGILKSIIEKNHKEFVHTTDKLMDIAFYYATRRPMSFGFDQIDLSPKLEQLKVDLGKEKDPTKQSLIIDEMEVELLKHLKAKHPDLYVSAASGASKGIGQLRQVLVAKGLVADPAGNVLPPIAKSINDGYTPEEYFAAAAGSRKGIIDRSLNTAHGGYSFRKTLYVCSNVQLNDSVRNCGTRRGLRIKLTPELFRKMRGRYVITGRDKYSPIDESMVGQMIELRTPIFCKTRDVCHICYGDLHKQLKTRNIGVAAANVTNLSERIMKSFHLGGAVSLKPVNLLEELMVNTDELLRPRVQKLVHQKDESLYSVKDLTMLTIDKTIFDKTPFKKEEDKIILPVGYFELNLSGLTLRSSIEQETVVLLTDEIEEDTDKITIIYGKGSEMYRVKPVPKEYTKLAQVMDGLVGGKSPSFDPESLYLKFMRTLYAFDEPYDSVHIEVIISNILRNKKNPQKPARIVEPYEYEMFSIKTLPLIISYPLGLAFENFGKAVQYGMISDRSPSSPIEKVMFGETLVTDKDILEKQKKKK